MAKRRKRRKWSDDEKRMICAQTVVPGVSVAQVARRYDLNANQIFNWLKDPKFASDAQATEDEAKYLPVEVIAEPEPPEPEVELSSGSVFVGQSPLTLGSLEIGLEPLLDCDPGFVVVGVLSSDASAPSVGLDELSDEFDLLDPPALARIKEPKAARMA